MGDPLLRINIPAGNHKTFGVIDPDKVGLWPKRAQCHRNETRPGMEQVAHHTASSQFSTIRTCSDVCGERLRLPGIRFRNLSIWATTSPFIANPCLLR